MTMTKDTKMLGGVTVQQYVDSARRNARDAQADASKSGAGKVKRDLRAASYVGRLQGAISVLAMLGLDLDTLDETEGL